MLRGYHSTLKAELQENRVFALVAARVLTETQARLRATPAAVPKVVGYTFQKIDKKNAPKVLWHL